MRPGRYPSRSTSQEKGWTARERRNGFGTEPRVKRVDCNSRWKISGNESGTNTMHSAQHLAEREVESAQAAFPGWGFVAIIATIRVPLGLGFMVMRERALCSCIAARMPCGMRDSALLRHEQQDDTEIME